MSEDREQTAPDDHLAATAAADAANPDAVAAPDLTSTPVVSEETTIPGPADEEDLPPPIAGAPPTRWPNARGPEPSSVRWWQGGRITVPLLLLSLLLTGTFVMLVAVEPTPRWLVFLVAATAVLGTDGVLRMAWPATFPRGRGGTDTAPYLFLPALVAISIPLLIEHNLSGGWVVVAALGGGVAFALVLVAQVSSLAVSMPIYPVARLMSTAACYFAAFSLLALTYVLDFSLGSALFAAGMVGTMLAVEVLREGQVDSTETLILAVVTGLALTEVRWTLHFIPVDGYLAGLVLLLAFFLVSGLLQAHVTRHLNAMVVAEFVAIAAAGMALVTLASQAGLG